MARLRVKLEQLWGIPGRVFLNMRALPRKQTGKISEAEMANRKRFAQAQIWLKPLIAFVRIGFKSYSPTSEGFVAAKSYLLKNAVEGASILIFALFPKK